jgi:hypothetical protein
MEMRNEMRKVSARDDCRERSGGQRKKRQRMQRRQRRHRKRKQEEAGILPSYLCF